MFIRQAKDIVYATVGLLTAVLNIAEIALIIRKKNKKAFDKLLLSLAVSDVFVGMAAAVFKLSDLIKEDEVKLLVANEQLNIVLISVGFSVTNLAAITADRFMAVRYPIKHRMILSARRVNVAIIFLWLFSLACAVFSSLFAFLWTSQIIFMVNAGLCCLLVFGVAITVCYALIFLSISKRTMRTATENEAEKNGARRGFALFMKGPYTAERSVQCTGCLVTLSFIICTYPFAFEFLISQSVKDISFVSNLMILLNSLLNPIIYFFKSYFGSRRGRPASTSTEMS